MLTDLILTHVNRTELHEVNISPHYIPLLPKQPILPSLVLSSPPPPLSSYFYVDFRGRLILDPSAIYLFHLVTDRNEGKPILFPNSHSTTSSLTL